MAACVSAISAAVALIVIMPSTAPSTFMRSRGFTSTVPRLPTTTTRPRMARAVRSSPRLTLASSSTMRSKPRPPVVVDGRLQVPRVAMVEGEHRRPGLADQLATGVAAGRADDRQAGGQRELDRGEAHGAAGAVHEHRLAGDRLGRAGAARGRRSRRARRGRPPGRYERSSGSGCTWSRRHSANSA